MKLSVPITLTSFFGISCFCCGGDLNQTIAKYVPLIREVSDEYDYQDITCEPALSTPRPMNCIIGHLSCGDVVEGNNSNGPMNWGDAMYRGAACTPQAHQYDAAPEAVWRLDIPPYTEATVRLDSNCADLDVLSFHWEDQKRCPKVGHAHNIMGYGCEMETDEGSGKIQPRTAERAESHLVVVDGKNGSVGNFRLTIECERYL